MIESVPNWLLDKYKEDYEKWKREDEKHMRDLESNPDVCTVDQTSEEFTLQPNIRLKVLST